MPTGKMIFRPAQSDLKPAAANTDLAESTKNPKYLKNPRMARQKTTLRISRHRGRFSRTRAQMASWAATKIIPKPALHPTSAAETPRDGLKRWQTKSQRAG